MGYPPGGGGTLHGWEENRKQEGKRSNQPLTLQPEHDTLIKFGAAAHVSLSQGLQGRQAQPGGHLLRDCDGSAGSLQCSAPVCAPCSTIYLKEAVSAPSRHA
jgi:hypothetical protein